MAAGAGNPQLELQVSLDLVFLRTQLSSLGKTIGEVPFSVIAKLDTNQLAKDIDKLKKEITVNINDSKVEALSTRVETVRNKLQELKGEKIEIPATIKAATTQKDVRKVRASLYRSLIEGEGKLLVPVSIRPAITQADIATFKRSVETALSGISVNVKANLQSESIRGGAKTQAEIDADVRRGLETISQMGSARMAGGTSGGVTDQARRTQLRNAIDDLTVASLRQVAKQLDVGGTSRLSKAKLIDKIVADASIEMVKKYLDPQAMMRGGDRNQLQKVLDTFARGVFNMLGMDPAAMLQQSRRQRLPAAINWQATAPRQAAAIGPSSRGRLLSAAPSRTAIAGASSPLGLLPSVTQRSTLKRDLEAFMKAASGSPSVAQGPGKLALSNEALGKRVSAILQEYFKIAEVQVKESFDPRELKRSLNVFSHIAQSLRDAEARTRQARVAQSVDSLMNAIDRSIKAAEASVRVRLAQVRELPQRPTQAMLPGARVAGFLPPAMGRAPSPYSSGPVPGESRQEMFARRTSEAFRRSAEREESVMQGGTASPLRIPPQPFGRDQPFMRAPSMPSGPAAATRLPAGYHDVNKLVKGLREADQYLQRSRVPLTGAIADLGNQFGYAIKQVLLFGTAYKALAFFMDLPRQAFDATKSLQLFENQINVLTGSAAEADRAFSFIDDIVGRLNIPLQSAREGFAQLYASMSPAGIPMGDVENLFEGMSAAAATLGMSSAEMDRMTLAFSQMASKGKIMTEEVTRQLGDVLPGALGKMAQAAQMEIPAFIDAMQKGQLSGEAMTAVLFNMGVILKKDFGEGASQGAKLLRGAMVEIQNSVQRMYEAFRPVVEDLAAQAIPTLSKAVQNVTKGVQTFAASFSSANKPLGELSGTALTVLNILNSLREIAKGVGVVFASILPTLAGVGKVLLFVAEQVARFINTGFGGWLTNVAAQALLLNAVLIKFAQLLALNLLPALLAATKSLLIFSARLQTVAAAKGVATAATFAFTGALKLLLIPLLKFAAPVAIVAGIMAIADAFGSASKRAGELRATAIDATNAIRGMSTTEAIQAGRAASSDIRVIQAISSREDVPNREGFVAVTEEEKSALERSGVSTRKQTTRGRGVRGIVDVVERNRLTAATLSAEGRRAESDFRVQQNRFEEQQASQALRPVVLQGADGKDGATERQQSLESYYNLLDQLAKAQTKHDIDMAQMEFDHKRSLMEKYYDMEAARANSLQKDALAYERDRTQIRLDRLEAEMKAEAAVVMARGRVASMRGGMEGAPGAPALPSPGGGGGGAIFGDTGRTFNAPGWVHGHFQNMDRNALVQDTVEVVAQLLQQGVPAELGSGTAFNAGMSSSQIEGLVRQGIGAHKKYASGVSAIDVFVPKGTSVPTPLSGVSNLGGAAGVTGNLPRGTQLMHLDPRSQAGGGARPVPGSERRDLQAYQEERHAIEARTESVKQGKELEDARAKALYENYINTVFPAQEQELQNSLNLKRIDLVRQGLSEDLIQTEVALFESAEKKRHFDEANQRLRDKGLISEEEYARRVEDSAAAVALYSGRLKEAAVIQRDFNYEQSKSAINKEMATIGTGLRSGLIGTAASSFEGDLASGEMSKERAMELALLRQEAELLKMAFQGIEDSILSVGDAIADVMTTGVAGLITGTMSAKEVFAGFLRDVGQALASTAKRMIAQYIAIGIAKIFAGLGGGSSAPNMTDVGKYADSGIGNINIGTFAPRAMGGPVGVNTPYLIGERGPELFVPFQSGRVISNNDLGAAVEALSGMQMPIYEDADSSFATAPFMGDNNRSSSFATAPFMGDNNRSGSFATAPFMGDSDNQSALSVPFKRSSAGSSAEGSFGGESVIRFETTTINGMEFVTKDEAEKIGRTAAARGADLAQRRIKNSPQVRRSIGVMN